MTSVTITDGPQRVEHERPKDTPEFVGSTVCPRDVLCF